MAAFLTRLKSFQKSLLGQILTAIYYLILLVLVLIFFSGHGEFIYEGF